MSNPHDVAEKAVWLETNLATFFLCREEVLQDETDMLKDIVNIILARINPIGVEELYDYLINEAGVDPTTFIVHEIEHMDEGQLDKTLKDAGVDTASMVDKVDKMLRVPDAGDIIKETIMRNNEIFKAGMKAQQELDK